MALAPQVSEGLVMLVLMMELDQMKHALNACNVVLGPLVLAERASSVIPARLRQILGLLRVCFVQMA